MPFFRKKVKVEFDPTTTSINHIAFIMDGNGRWAKRRGLPRSLGHKEGCKRIKEIALACQDFGIHVMSLFCFSTENWKRPKQEVDYLFQLLEQFFVEEIDELNQKKVRVHTLGDISKLPKSTIEAINKAKDITKNNSDFILNICLNYGGKDEIVKACKNVVKDVVDGNLNIDDINEEVFQNHMECFDLPPIDCMVRTSGEQRISNYMLWELAYAELIFVDEHWPDFKVDSLKNVLYLFSLRNRRYGGIKSGS